MKRILFTLSLLVGFLAGYTQMTNNGGTITVESGATLVIEGNYTSSNAGVLKIDGAVQLKGNLINNGGTIDPASVGTLTFNGATPQQIGGTTSTSFGSAVVVNNTGNGVSLTGADAVLTKALTLTSGKVTLNAYDLTMASAGISVTSGNYVVTNNAAGELKAVVAASPVTFPVGTASSYNPVILANSGTSDTYGVVFTGATPGGWTGTDHAVNGTWAVSEFAANGSNLTVTPQWNTSNQQAGFDNTDCAVGLQVAGDNIAWTASGAAVANGSAWTRTGSGFTSVGNYMVGDYFFEGIDFDLDVFLAGPYNSGVMGTALKTNNLIPLTDPYGNSTTVASIANPNTVDWIKVELRSSPTTVAKSYSFFVDKDGNVLNTGGTAGVKLTGVAKGSYYVAVKHRNHLGAMTASAVNLATGPYAFDFSAGTGIYGTNSLRNMGAKWALWAGDTDGDGDVEFTTGNSDITPVSAAVLSNGNTDPTFVGAAIYSQADADLNGTVQFTTGSSDITPVSASVLNNPANVSGDPTLVLTQQLP
jgi:hypothetical protein